MREHAKSKGGLCLSEKYTNSKTHLTWQCKKGHVWNATSSNILRGKWCPQCSGNVKLGIDIFSRVANDRGGKLISKKYLNIDNNLEWECSEGHRWQATGNNVKTKNTWCPICAGNQKLGIDVMQNLAKQNEGEFLSTSYGKLADKYRWRCKKGHEWETTGFSVKIDNTWCPKCAGFSEYKLSDLAQHATQLGGKIISSAYTDMDSKYSWKCKFNHKWEATWYKIKQGQWCPRCSTNNIKEEKVRICFESLFGTDFPKTYPTFLINADGNKMEYDGFSEKLNIAFEYHGEQHFEINYFTKTQKDLDKRIQDDQEKLRLSESYGIKLFVLTYKDAEDTFKSQIIEMAKKHGVEHLINSHNEPDYSLAYLAHDRYDELLTIVEAKNGELLSKKWEGALKYYEIKCNVHNHTWCTTGRAILNDDNWCVKCGREEVNTLRFKESLKELKKYAEINNASLISKEYKGQHHTYKFHCENGHLVEIPWKYKSKRKYFCRICEEKEIKQENFIRKAIITHNNKYDYSKVIFTKSIEVVVIICPLHGEFYKSPNKHISSKQGCPKCSKNKRRNKSKLPPTKPKLH